MSKSGFLLIDLPVFPKGVVSLGLPLLAAYLRPHFEVKIHDLNHFDWGSFRLEDNLKDVLYVGMKVSSQNHTHAAAVTQEVRRVNPNVKVIWGGEFPSLMPDICLQHADSLVQKRIEGCLSEFLTDLNSGELKRIYEGGSDFASVHSTPAFDLQLKDNGHYSFMGMPMETSVGCDRFCRFCMVHTMQPGVKFKLSADMQRELDLHEGKFLNIVDYNIGVSKDHLFAICSEIQHSKVTGWMGEMCLETLDDDDVLKALQASRCKMIYCGLESLSEEGLKSVNKHKTNHPDNYRRIIKKVQEHGLNVASGLIVGLDGTDRSTFQTMLDFYDEVGIEYVKITFLTYNPGTYFYKAMQRSGAYTTDEISRFDGNHLTYLANGVKSEDLYSGTINFINDYYRLRSIFRRSKKAHSKWLRRMEFVLFNICYREAYIDWIRFDVLKPESGGIFQLMNLKFSKPWYVGMSEILLNKIRIRSYYNHLSRNG